MFTSFSISSWPVQCSVFSVHLYVLFTPCPVHPNVLFTLMSCSPPVLSPRPPPFHLHSWHHKLQGVTQYNGLVQAQVQVQQWTSTSTSTHHAAAWHTIYLHNNGQLEDQHMRPTHSVLSSTSSFNKLSHCVKTIWHDVQTTSFVNTCQLVLSTNCFNTFCQWIMSKFNQRNKLS